MAYYVPRSTVESYVRSAAAARNINPDIAARVVRQESGFNVNASNISSRETSYGVFQLNTMGGLGNAAQRAGINPADPSQWQRQVDFSLDTVSKDGWRQWYGARDVGISRWQGVGDYKGGAGQNFNAPGSDPATGAQGYDPAMGGGPGKGSMGSPQQYDPAMGGSKTTSMDELYKSGTITPSPTVPRAIDQQTKVMSETEKKTEEARAKAEAKQQKELTTKYSSWLDIVMMRSYDLVARLVFITAGVILMWAAIRYLGLGRTITQAIKPARSI
jgi:hypothetical protein